MFFIQVIVCDSRLTLIGRTLRITNIELPIHHGQPSDQIKNVTSLNVEITDLGIRITANNHLYLIEVII